MIEQLRPAADPGPTAGETLVADIMSRRIVAIRSDADLSVALDTFLRTALRHLVVVDPDRTCRGLLSAEQVLALLGTTGRRSRRVADHVRPQQPRVHQAEPVRNAAQVMVLELVDALPVVDDDGRVVGVVTWSDIVAMVAGRHLRGDRP
ncbi:CBS domain-containing protein [Nocardioides sp. MAHUQ-72]|uniref:CBS domain-containing protein n=1 Tax=unclassified Nocardioides TaxID=2615069 RepID=UPI003606B66C